MVMKELEKVDVVHFKLAKAAENACAREDAMRNELLENKNVIALLEKRLEEAEADARAKVIDEGRVEYTYLLAREKVVGYGKKLASEQ